MPQALLIKSSGAAHRWLGLMAGLFIYLICLTGTILVFFPDLIRWEQPGMLEDQSYTPAVLDRALAAAIRNKPPAADHLYLTLNDPIRRTMIFVSDLRDGWMVNPDGTLGPAVHPYWTQLLMKLHIYLMLPMTWGDGVVSALGAFLCALLLSGLLAHPAIVKDAFAFRLQRSTRLKYLDIHNRLAVWGAPFHLMIALTGASFGLAAPVLALESHDAGSAQSSVVNAVYGVDPGLRQRGTHFAVGRVLQQMRQIAPQATPIFIEVYDAGTPGQFMDVSARIPRRLLFGEDYRFDMAGNYLGRLGYSDGAGALQALQSAYRLHTGMFGGLWVRLLYFALGLSLTVVSATGVTLWLERRKHRDIFNLLWPALVWGAPAALIASAITDVLMGVSGVSSFLIALGVSAALALSSRDGAAVRLLLQSANVLLLLVLLAGYAYRFGGAAFSGAALDVNLSLMSCMSGVAVLLFRSRSRAHRQEV